MAIQYACGRWSENNYLMNGGGWMLALPASTQQAIAQAFLTLPLVIEIQTSAGLIGIVHAEPAGLDWNDFLARLKDSDPHAEQTALWSRARISKGDRMDVQGVHAVYVGHTPQERAKSLGNVHYIDTGAVFGGRLTVVQIDGQGMDSRVAEAFT